MKIQFESSRVHGGRSSGRLTIRVTHIPDAREPVCSDEVWFSVPEDFHVHNDSVAAACMTLVGRRSPSIEFNFPISRRCADLLKRYYTLESLGSIDENLEPRRPGRFLALNFSGGLDSVGLWLLLHELMGVAYKTVTTEYRGFIRERTGYRDYHRDVTCKTNLRDLGYDIGGRFNCAVPLLYADYADLWGVTSGHTMNQVPYSFESLERGQPPAFLVQDAALNAGGLAEAHLVRGLYEAAINSLIVRVAPWRIDAALKASAPASSWKHAVKALSLRYFAEVAGIDLPEALRQVPFPHPKQLPPDSYNVQFRGVWMYKRLGPAITLRVDPRIGHADLAFIPPLALDFFERYNTNLTHVVPLPLRTKLLHAFHKAGILPYAESDFRDLEVVRSFVAANSASEIGEPLVGRASDPGLWELLQQFADEASEPQLDAPITVRRHARRPPR